MSYTDDKIRETYATAESHRAAASAADAQTKRAEAEAALVRLKADNGDTELALLSERNRHELAVASVHAWTLRTVAIGSSIAFTSIVLALSC